MDDTQHPEPAPLAAPGPPPRVAAHEMQSRLVELADADASEAPALAERLAADLSLDLEADPAASHGEERP